MITTTQIRGGQKVHQEQGQEGKGREGYLPKIPAQCFLEADHKASLGGWDATGSVHRKKIMMMMVTIMAASKPL